MKKKRSFSVNVWTSLVFMAVGAALLSFGGMLQAQTQTYYTEFNFNFTGNVVTGADGYTAEITTTGGVEGNIQVALTNKDTGTIAGHFDVVDAVQIEGGVWACQDKSTDDDVFGHHFTRPNDFTLNPGESDTYTFTYNFPRYYSGNYMGCILYYETDTARDVATTSRKALLVSAQVASDEVTYSIKAIPHGRLNTYKDSGYVKIYDTGWNIVFQTGVLMNDLGEGQFDAILEPGTYHIVYKGIASFPMALLKQTITGERSFEFTSLGDMLTGYLVDNDGNLVLTDNGETKLLVGDLHVDGLINGTDLSMIMDADHGVRAAVVEGQNSTNNSPYCQAEDINCENSISVDDVGLVAAMCTRLDVFGDDGIIYSGGVPYF